jgi:hypothetical protein
VMYGSEGLFRRPDSRRAIEGQTHAMREAIDSEAADHVLQVDVEAWAEALAERYAIKVPLLRRDQLRLEPPKQVRVRPWHASDRTEPALRYTVRVPFDGEEDVFDLAPSSFTTKGRPPGWVEGDDTLVCSWDYREGGAAFDRSVVDVWLDDVQRELDWWKADVGDVASRLRDEARQRIAQRKENLSRHEAAVAESGIPVAGPQDKTYIPRAIVRRPGKPQRPTRTGRSITLVPALGDDVHEQIVETLRSGCRSMERRLETCRAMDEEARRDVLLTLLNDGFYSAAGEAVNGAGKTDLLIPFEDGNLFVGECKVWAGKDAFQDAIDQLFTYRTWRDSKLALIVFVPQKSLTNVIKTARSTLEAHAEFAGWIDHTQETELRCRVTWPGDREQVGTLTVLFAHIPR